MFNSYDTHTATLTVEVKGTGNGTLTATPTCDDAAEFVDGYPKSGGGVDVTKMVTSKPADGVAYKVGEKGKDKDDVTVPTKVTKTPVKKRQVLPKTVDPPTAVAAVAARLSLALARSPRACSARSASSAVDALAQAEETTPSHQCGDVVLWLQMKF